MSADKDRVWGAQYPAREECLLLLTALNGVGGYLQGEGPAIGLRDMNPEDQPHTRVLPTNVCLALAQLNVRVSEL